jgi:hypothetical protein
MFKISPPVKKLAELTIQKPLKYIPIILDPTKRNYTLSVLESHHDRITRSKESPENMIKLQSLIDSKKQSTNEERKLYNTDKKFADRNVMDSYPSESYEQSLKLMKQAKMYANMSRMRSGKMSKKSSRGRIAKRSGKTTRNMSTKRSRNRSTKRSGKRSRRYNKNRSKK